MSASPPPRFRPGLEGLEDRCLPSAGRPALPLSTRVGPRLAAPSRLTLSRFSDGGVAAGPVSRAAAPAAAGPARAAGKGDTPDSLAGRVLALAQAWRGTQVGDGECATLALRALQAARAKTTADYGVGGPDADYVWGTLVLTASAGGAADWGRVKPGSVLQFRDVVLQGRAGAGWQAAHHTAIVTSNDGGGQFTVLEQNVTRPGGTDAQARTVQQHEMNLAALTQGTVWVYQPAPAR